MGGPSYSVDLDLDASPVELVLEVDLRERKGAVQRRDARLPRSNPTPDLCGNQMSRRISSHGPIITSNAIDATPARWRGDAGSSPLDRAGTAESSPRNDLVKKAPDALVDFHPAPHHALRELDLPHE